jgi:TP901 family phage tail tape measure protein
VALNNLGLGFVFTARDLASAKMAGLERRFSSLDERVTGGTERLTGAFRQLGIGLAVFTAGAAAVAGALSLANAAGRFEQGLAAVGAVTRATTRELAMLRDAAIRAGIETQFSPDEAVAGLQSLATAGQTAEQATRTLVPVLDLAAGSLGQLGVAQAAEAVVGTLNAYGLAAEEAAGVTDKLLRITQLTNFQTRDFEAGLSKAAATGAVFSQGLDDVLITMGLLRNRNIDASSSATAFRESVRRVGAESRAQQAITSAGVKVFDEQTGQMRSIVDIMNDFAQATATMSDEERNRRVVTAFGARGLLAFNAILNASFTTMRDGQQVTLRGAEAIAALRDEMGGAQGTAARFREQLLDTFEGQKTLLQGTLQTFAVVLGEPFAAVFKPIVRTLVGVLNLILRAFQAIPAPIKRIFAGIVLAAGSFLMLVGGVIAAKAAIALLVIAFKALGITVGGILATLLPAILIVAVLGAVVAGFVVAFQRNVGGIADFVRRIGERVSLFFNGLKQLFEQGGFSGAVREELNRAENLGLKRFLISLYQIVFRIQQVWEGFKEGFTSTIAEARPVFDDLMDAFSELGQEIGALFSGLTGSAAGLPSSEFRSFGQAAGAAIATVVRWLTQLIAVFTRITSGIIAGFRSMQEFIGPAFEVVGEALGQLRDAWNALTGSSKDSTKATNESTSAWRSLGEFLGQVLGGVVTVITLAFAGLIKVVTAVIWVVNTVKDAFIAAGTWIGETAAKIYLWFTETLPNAISNAIATVVGFFRAIGQFFVGIGRWFMGLFRSIADGIKGFLSPVVDFFRGVGRAIKAVFDAIADFVIKLLRKIPDALLPASLERLKRSPLSTEVRTEDSFAAIGGTESTAARSEAATSAMPAAADAAGRTNEFAQLEANMMAFANAQAQRQGQAPPFQINVQVDGETIARANHRADRDVATRSFSPVPAY